METPNLDMIAKGLSGCIVSSKAATEQDQAKVLEIVLKGISEDARAELAALKAEVASQTARGDVLGDTCDSLRKALGVLGVAVTTGDVVREANRLNEKIDALEAELEDWRETSRRVLDEECAQDEKHCTCVPHLRAEIERLRAKADLCDEMASTIAAAHTGWPGLAGWLVRYEALTRAQETT